MISHAREKGPERAFAKSYARAYEARPGGFLEILARARTGRRARAFAKPSRVRARSRDCMNKKGLFLAAQVAKPPPRQSSDTNAVQTKLSHKP